MSEVNKNIYHKIEISKIEDIIYINLTIHLFTSKL